MQHWTRIHDFIYSPTCRVKFDSILELGYFEDKDRDHNQIVNDK